jgi:hypothetical protein
MANDTSLESLLRHERLCWEAMLKINADSRPKPHLVDWSEVRWREAAELALQAGRECIGGRREVCDVLTY